MTSNDPQQEEQTFGAYAHGGSGADRHLEARGTPAVRQEQAEQPSPSAEGDGAQLPSQASLPDVPTSCADQKPG